MTSFNSISVTVTQCLRLPMVSMEVLYQTILLMVELEWFKRGYGNIIYKCHNYAPFDSYSSLSFHDTRKRLLLHLRCIVQSCPARVTFVDNNYFRDGRQCQFIPRPILLPRGRQPEGGKKGRGLN